MINRNFTTSRRGMIRSLAAGSMLLPGILQSLLADSARGAVPAEINPLAPRAPHYFGKAKRVIFMYMSGDGDLGIHRRAARRAARWHVRLLAAAVTDAGRRQLDGNHDGMTTLR